MKSINFAEATHILGASQGYQPLAVIRTEDPVINNSYWQLEPEEIELLKHGHVIHLGVLGGQPPVLMAVSNRPVEAIPYPTPKAQRIVGLGKAEKVRIFLTEDEAKQILGGTSDAPAGIIPGAEVVQQKLKCAVCDGTGFKDGAAGGDEACRFCNGGYLDAAN